MVTYPDRIWPRLRRLLHLTEIGAHPKFGRIARIEFFSMSGNHPTSGAFLFDDIGRLVTHVVSTSLAYVPAYNPSGVRVAEKMLAELGADDAMIKDVVRRSVNRAYEHVVIVTRETPSTVPGVDYQVVTHLEPLGRWFWWRQA